MSFEKKCLKCESLNKCKQLESQRWDDAIPLWIPLGWLADCPDGWHERVLTVEIQALLDQDKLAPDKRQWMPRKQREKQIASLLQGGPMPAGEIARRIGLQLDTARQIARRMFKRGQLQRQQRGRFYWYGLAA